MYISELDNSFFPVARRNKSYILFSTFISSFKSPSIFALLEKHKGIRLILFSFSSVYPVPLLLHHICFLLPEPLLFASPIAVILVPIVGVCAWQLAAAAVTGFIAKENVVGTLAVCYGLSAFIDTEELALVGDGNVVASAMAITKVAALAYLMFNLFTPPCFAALGAMNSEMQSKKWLWGGIALLLGTGYVVAFLVYQIGTLITTGGLGNGFVPGLIAVVLMVAVVVGIINKTNTQFKAEYELKKAA